MENKHIVMDFVVCSLKVGDRICAFFCCCHSETPKYYKNVFASGLHPGHR